MSTPLNTIEDAQAWVKNLCKKHHSGDFFTALRCENRQRLNELKASLNSSTKTSAIQTLNEDGFDNFIGYWLLDNIEDINNATLLEFFRDEETSEPRVKFYTGTQNLLREVTNSDLPSSGYGVGENSPAGVNTSINEFGDVVQVEMLADKSVRFFNTSEPGTALGPDELRSTLRIQDDDNDVAWGAFWTNWDGTSDSPELGTLETMEKYVRLSEKPPIQLRDEPHPENNNPVNMFQAFFDHVVYKSMTQKAYEVVDQDYIGFEAMKALFEKIRDEGVVRTAKTSLAYRGGTHIGIWKTVDPVGSLTTTFHTQEPHSFNSCSNVTVSGLKGAYAVLNGTHRTNANRASTTVPNGRRNWQEDDSTEYCIYLIVDSSGIDEEYDPTVHGVAALTAQHGPVTEATEYRELLAAVFDFYVNSFGSCTHGRLSGWAFNTEITSPVDDDFNLTVPDTFDEVQQLIDSGDAQFPLVFRTRSSRGHGGAFFYYNGSISGLGLIFGGNAGNFNFNDPFGLGTTTRTLFDPRFNIDIPLENYLQPNKTFSLYWTVTGEVKEEEPITGMLLQNGYPSNGSRPSYLLQPYLQQPEPLVDEFGVHPYLLTATATFFPFPNIGAHANYTCGIVDKRFTKNCETVAYIRQLFEFPVDLFQGSLFSLYSLTFGRKDLGTYLSPFIEEIATMMAKLNEFNPTRYIIDIRENLGGVGVGSSSWGYFFGANRPNEFTAAYPPGDGSRPVEPFFESGIQTAFDSVKPNTESDAVINTDLIAKKFPNSIVRSNDPDRPINVIILTNSNAGSGGDTFGRFFVGADPNAQVHDLGFNVYSRVVGDIDSRLKNGVLPDDSLPIDPINPRLKDANGNPVTPIGILGENGVAYRDRHSTENNQPVYMQPAKLLPGWYDQVHWQDMGLVPPTLPYPIKSSKPCDSLHSPWKNCKCSRKVLPNFNDNSTWRDVHLEYALFEG